MIRLFFIAVLSLAAPVAGSGVAATAALAQDTFSVPALPYSPDALEPVIDAETMSLHHGRHHRAYVDALNRAVAADPALAGQPLEALVGRAGTLPAAVRNNAGGHWNHSFFWSIMAPPGKGGAPTPQLAAAIDAQFGSIEAMKRAFEAAGAGQFGSGWVWLIVTEDGRLAITVTPNQDNPLMDVVKMKGAPILGNDVWEHAYYLKYRNRRGDYLSAWWQVVNWSEVSRRYAEALRR